MEIPRSGLLQKSPPYREDDGQSEELQGETFIMTHDSVKEIDFGKLGGVVPVVVQDATTREVLMVAFMNKEALRKTIETKRGYYWSRSRRKLWKKGETSGNEQIVHDILIDCDADAVLLKIEQIGGACHTGYRSCFYRTINDEIVGEKLFEPENVYKR